MFRNVFYAEVLNGELQTSKMVTVRFTEFEACVATVTSKVKEALGQLESVILTDSHGNEILDSEGTRGEYDRDRVHTPKNSPLIKVHTQL